MLVPREARAKRRAATRPRRRSRIMRVPQRQPFSGCRCPPKLCMEVHLAGNAQGLRTRQEGGGVMSRTRIDYRIVSDVRDWMREAGLADLAFKLRLKYDGGGHLWESDSDWPAAEPPASRPAGKFLSNLGQRIVDYLRG